MKKPVSCAIPEKPDHSRVTIVELPSEVKITDYHEAMKLADIEAEKRLGEYMLVSWYDRDRDYESPQHSSECHQESAVPGYVDYGIHHGATLKIEFEKGRFVFFYLPVEI